VRADLADRAGVQERVRSGAKAIARPELRQTIQIVAKHSSARAIGEKANATARVGLIGDALVAESGAQ
jgi:hypothetical protein